MIGAGVPIVPEITVGETAPCGAQSAVQATMSALARMPRVHWDSVHMGL
jgi:hypothetical protein